MGGPTEECEHTRGEWPLGMCITHVFLFRYFDIWGFADPLPHPRAHTHIHTHTMSLSIPRSMEF